MSRGDAPARRAERQTPNEGLTLAEIGQILGVTESRVCQTHTKAVLQLRAKMRDAR